MQFYTIAEGIYKSAAEPFVQRKEVVKVSMPLQYGDKLYREIVFLRPMFGKGWEAQGYIYVTEDGELVKSDNVKRKIADLGNKASSLLGDEAVAKMKKTMVSEKDLKREINDLLQMKEALNILKSEGAKNADKIIPILESLPEYKKENNAALAAVVERVQSLEDEVVTRERIDEINSLYQKPLMINFKRVLHMKEGLDYYEEVRAGVARKNRFRLITINSDFSGRFARLEQGINTMKKVITMYEPVINLTEEEYVKFLGNIDKDRVDERMEMARG